MSWKEIIKKCLSVASAPIRQKCQLLRVHVLIGHDQFTDHASEVWHVLRESCSWNSLWTSTSCVPSSPSSRRRCAGDCVSYYTLYYIVTAAADTYCFVNFGSTLNPSMLMLVDETNSSEASSFLSALISAEVLFSSVGWILLLALIQILIALFRKRLIKFYVFLVTCTGIGFLEKTNQVGSTHHRSHACQLRNPLYRRFHHRIMHFLAQQGRLSTN